MTEKLLPFDPSDFSAERIRHVSEPKWRAVDAKMVAGFLTVVWQVNGDLNPYTYSPDALADQLYIYAYIRLTPKVRTVKYTIVRFGLRNELMVPAGSATDDLTQRLTPTAVRLNADGTIEVDVGQPANG